MNEGGDGYDLLKRPSVHQYETIEEMLLKFLSESSLSELAAIDRADNLIISEWK